MIHEIASLFGKKREVMGTHSGHPSRTGPFLPTTGVGEGLWGRKRLLAGSQLADLAGPPAPGGGVHLKNGPGPRPGSFSKPKRGVVVEGGRVSLLWKGGVCWIESNRIECECKKVWRREGISPHLFNFGGGDNLGWPGPPDSFPGGVYRQIHMTTSVWEVILPFTTSRG